jgi:hypothetical protein
MLVLSRRVGQRIMVRGCGMTISVVNVRGKTLNTVLIPRWLPEPSFGSDRIGIGNTGKIRLVLCLD